MTRTSYLRHATPADAEAIGAFQTTAWEDAYRGLVSDNYLDSTTVVDRIGRWRARLASGERRVVLACDGASLIGVASSSNDSAQTVELQSLYVAQSVHGTGVAARLLRAVIADAPAFLWVFDHNPRAAGFYAKHGFTPTGERRLDVATGVMEERWQRGCPSTSDSPASGPTRAGLLLKAPVRARRNEKSS